MKKYIIYVISIGVIIALSAMSYAKYSINDVDNNTSSKSYNITVTIKGCKDMYCLDQCDTCWIRVYRNGGSTLDVQPYDGSCIYYFTVNASDVCAELNWVSSCNSLFSSPGTQCQDVSINPNIEIDPTCN
jgi:hypothetical protein